MGAQPKGAPWRIEDPAQPSLRMALRAVKTVFLVGAGSAEGSWEPVQRAIDRFEREVLGRPVSIPPGHAYLWFSLWVFQRRFVASRRAAEQATPSQHRALNTRFGRDERRLKALI